MIQKQKKTIRNIMWVINSGLRNGANNVVQTFAEKVPNILNFHSTFLSFDKEGPAIDRMREITGSIGYHLSLDTIENDPEKAKELLKKVNPDFVHLNTESSSILSPILKQLGIPHVLEFHGGPKYDVMLDVVEKYFGGKRPTYQEISNLYQSPDALVSPAKVVFDNEHYGKVVGYTDKQVIYNGIEELQPIIDSLPSKDAIRKKWGFTPEDNIMLVPGNVEPRKGQDIAVTEFNDLLKSGKIPKESKMFIVGYRTSNFDSPLEKDYIIKIKNYIKTTNLNNNIKLIPAQPNLWEFYKMADSALLPTRNELIPLTVVEARKFGLPVIVSSLSGTPEEIDNFKDGILTQTPPANGAFDKNLWFKPVYEKTPGTVELKDAMIAVINDNGNLKKRFYENGQKRDKVQFSVETMCNDYANLVRRIIRRKDRQKAALESNEPKIVRSKSTFADKILSKNKNINKTISMEI